MTLLELSCSGAVLILAAACLRQLTWRRLPRETFVALWWVAALRLLIPVELPARCSVYTLLDALTRPASAAPADPVISAAPAAPPVMVLPSGGGSPAVSVSPGVPAAPPFPVKTAVYLTVAAVLALAFLASYLRWRRRFRESLPAEGPCVSRWQGRRDGGKKSPVQVRVSDRIAAPLTYGLVRPVILLPKTMDLSDEDALLCVLTHEEVHIRRLDGLLKLLLTAALCVHWFNPAVWLLYVLSSRDMELCCDEAVVRRLGEDRRELYALTLIRMAELQSTSVPLCSSFSENGMEERIKAIMSIKKRSWIACMIALALVLGMTTAFATSAKPQEADSAPESETPWNEDMPDYELHLQASEEAAAQWDEQLAPYAPFGLTWTFEDPDLDGNGLTMTFEGHEVRGIFDGREGIWISEHAGNGTYGSGAVELYAMYDDSGLTGLRLATEEEQAAWTASREAARSAVEALGESLRYEEGHIYFVIPEGEGLWSIFIQGRILMEDGSGMSVHYLETESEKGEWTAGKTYSFALRDALHDELTMEASFEGGEAKHLDLTPLLPEDQKPLALPEGEADVPQGDGLMWPVDSDQITNSFGDRANPGGEGTVTHSGVDIGGMEQGTPIYAAGSGTVKEAGFNASDGNFVRIDHGSGQETFYAHCRSVLVKTGDAVTRGQTIATVGSSGMSTGTHLHYEVLVNGQSVDPLSYQRQTHSYQIDSTIVGMGKQVGVEEEGKSVPVCAIQDGLILNAGVRDYGYESRRGPFVEILYNGKSTMTYFGCDKLLVKTGDKVRAGDVIAWWNNGNLYSYGEGSANELGSFETERQKWQTWAAENLVDGGYPRNSRGETYGNIFFEEYLGYEPDLMAASSSTDGDGYVLREDLRFELSLSPEERDAYRNWCEENKVSGYTVPLYDSEHNLIGTQDGVEDGLAPRSYHQVTLEELKEARAQGFPNARGSAPQEGPDHPFKTIEEAQEAVQNGWRRPDPDVPEEESGSLSALSVQQAQSAEALAKEWLVNGEYPRNKNGQTYAPNESLTWVVGVPPDLVGAVATNGKEGYVSLEGLGSSGTHLFWGLWKSKTDLNASEPRSLPVYDAAGEVIGEFIVEAGLK